LEYKKKSTKSKAVKTLPQKAHQSLFHSISPSFSLFSLSLFPFFLHHQQSTHKKNQHWQQKQCQTTITITNQQEFN
jgi:hypothetical protein